MDNYSFSPIPDYQNHVEQMQQLLGKLNMNVAALDEWNHLWRTVNRFAIRSMQLEKKWKGAKKATGINPIGMIRKDLNQLIFKLNLGMPSNLSASEWGIQSTQKLMDILPFELPYLSNTNYYMYLSEISKLIDDVIYYTRHGVILKLLRELGEHRDSTVIGQYSSNEMVEYFKYLNSTSNLTNRSSVIKFTIIYQSLCGIYEKDMVFTHCLLNIIENRFEVSYKEIREKSFNQRTKSEFIQHVRTSIPLFDAPFNRFLRNANAHTDIETDDLNRLILVSDNNGLVMQFTYDQIYSITREMSALVSAFRFLAIVLSNNDWKQLHALLN